MSLHVVFILKSIMFRESSSPDPKCYKTRGFPYSLNSKCMWARRRPGESVVLLLCHLNIEYLKTSQYEVSRLLTTLQLHGVYRKKLYHTNWTPMNLSRHEFLRRSHPTLYNARTNTTGWDLVESRWEIYCDQCQYVDTLEVTVPCLYM